MIESLKKNTKGSTVYSGLAFAFDTNSCITASSPTFSAQNHLFLSGTLSLSPILLLISHPPLLCVSACGSAPERAATVYLSKLPISAYCQWKPRKLITKLIMVPGVEYMLRVYVQPP